MYDEQLLLPVAALIELVGVLTLITNESVIGPVDFGFSLPYLVSADIQGFGLILAGSGVMMYAMSQLK